MDRVIKFRAWDKEKKEFVKIAEFMDNDDGSFRVYGIYPQDGSYEKVDSDELKNIVLMQGTGMKDKNDAEIYEGDIVKVRQVMCTDCGRTYDKIFICGWEQMFARFNLRDVRYAPYGWFDKSEREVIGDIYSKPELLEDAF